MVGRDGLQCHPKKIEDVKSWPVPDCLKSVRQFLGFVRYYRRFISNFADMAEPLVSLTGKDVPFVWRPACSTAFTNLRDALVRAPILSFPTENGDYILDTDASNFGLGGVLSQIQNNVERVIAYCSRALRPSQHKYCTTKREMLAAVSMCIQLRDGPVATYSTTVPVFYHTSCMPGARKCRRTFEGTVNTLQTVYSPRLPGSGHNSEIVRPTIRRRILVPVQFG